VGTFNIADIMTLPEKRVAEETRRCPLCGKKMRKASIGHDIEVVVDVCPRGEGLWFDGGELGQVIRQLLDKPSAETGAPQRVVTFLGEVFHTRE